MSLFLHLQNFDVFSLTASLPSDDGTSFARHTEKFANNVTQIVQLWYVYSDLQRLPGTFLVFLHRVSGMSGTCNQLNITSLH